MLCLKTMLVIEFRRLILSVEIDYLSTEIRRVSAVLSGPGRIQNRYAILSGQCFHRLLLLDIKTFDPGILRCLVVLVIQQPGGCIAIGSEPAHSCIMGLDTEPGWNWEVLQIKPGIILKEPGVVVRHCVGQPKKGASSGIGGDEDDQIHIGYGSELDLSQPVQLRGDV